MPTVSAKISKKEHDVITQYANACGESISNLIRKVLIKEATYMVGFGGSPEYECDILTPEGCSDEEDTEITKEAFNKSRRILGFEEIENL